MLSYGSNDCIKEQHESVREAQFFIPSITPASQLGPCLIYAAPITLPSTVDFVALRLLILLVNLPWPRAQSSEVKIGGIGLRLEVRMHK